MAVLVLEHEIMRPVNDGVPKLAGVVPADLERVTPVIRVKLREFFRAVIERDLVHLPEDFAIQEVPWRQFIDDLQQQA